MKWKIIKETDFAKFNLESEKWKSIMCKVHLVDKQNRALYIVNTIR